MSKSVNKIDFYKKLNIDARSLDNADLPMNPLERLIESSKRLNKVMAQSAELSNQLALKLPKYVHAWRHEQPYIYTRCIQVPFKY